MKITVGAAVTILNAISTGKGATIGTSPVHDIFLEQSNNLEFDTGRPEIDHSLLRSCVSVFEQHTNKLVQNVKISIDTTYPPAKGMKTSSAVSSGVIHLLNQKFNTNLSTENIINLSADASIAAGVSITGAIDDAYGCYIGGFHVTNNIERSVVANHQLDFDREVIFLIPAHSTPKSSIDIKLDLLDKHIMKQAYDAACSGNWKTALEKNSRVYGQYLLDDVTILDELEDKLQAVVGLNGAGPSLFAISKSNDMKNNLEIISEEFAEYNYMITQLRSSL